MFETIGHTNKTLTEHNIAYLLETINRFEGFLTDAPEKVNVIEQKTIDEHDAKLQKLYGLLT
jgi:hypothetical protein